MLSSTSPFQKKFIDNRLQSTKTNYAQGLMFIFSIQCLIIPIGQITQALKQDISKNTTVNSETIDQFKRKISEIEETISHPFFKKIYTMAKEQVGGMIGSIDLRKLLEKTITDLLKLNKDKNISTENKKMIAEVLDSLTKLQALIASI